ncbi:MAG: rod shape-determining protein MreD [Finegoldia sp.]|nr:rod shape-determining protein MreD [Finegoldia sp.]
MNKVKIAIIILINLILQATLISRLPVYSVYANFSIPILVALSIGFGEYIGSISGLIIGLIEDLIFSPVIGVRALIYFTAGFLIGSSEAGINKKDPRSGMIITGFLTLYYTIVYYIVIFITQGQIDPSYLKGPIFIELVLNVITYFIIFKIFNKIFEFPKFRLR